MASIKNVLIIYHTLGCPLITSYYIIITHTWLLLCLWILMMYITNHERKLPITTLVVTCQHVNSKPYWYKAGHILCLFYCHVIIVCYQPKQRSTGILSSITKLLITQWKGLVGKRLANLLFWAFGKRKFSELIDQPMDY